MVVVFPIAMHLEPGLTAASAEAGIENVERIKRAASNLRMCNRKSLHKLGLVRARLNNVSLQI